MNISMACQPWAIAPAQHCALSLQANGEKPLDVVNGFNASERRFGENFDCSTHAAVIKMMMMTFGQSPADMFEHIKPSGDGYDITMKDEFKVHVSHQELQQTAQASRFAGNDGELVESANFVLAAFVKRKQSTGRHASFAGALDRALQGETTQRCLQGMGVFGLSQYVSSSDMTAKGAMGVMGTHNFGAALVMKGVKHEYGRQRGVEHGYGYMLFDDKSVPFDEARKVTHVAAGMTPTQIWDGFYQGVEGNCVTVSAIKAAIVRFWQDPDGIYKQIQVTPDGFEVVMRDSFKLQITHDEMHQAAVASNLRGLNEQLLNYANFLYAVSAKRAQMENNDFRARESYAVALQTLNDGEFPGEALRRLGLFGYMRESTVEELVSGAIGTLADTGHSVAVIDGSLDFYGQKQDLASSRWRNSGLRALKLV